MIARRSSFVRLLAALVCLVAPAAHAQTSRNTAAINMPTSASDGRAVLYPSPIAVSGAPTSISYLSVTLSGFSHSFVDDVHVLLVSPTGQKILLMANTHGTNNAINNTLTFVPDGTATLPNSSGNVVSGVYACSVYSPTDLPAPAPAGPYGTSLAPLIGTNANGTWNLYVWDDVDSFNNGTFAGGWSITFNRAPALPLPTAFSYQGVLTKNAQPINGNANVRFTVCNSPTLSLSSSFVAAATVRNFTGISDGLVATSLDFGAAIDTPQSLWLNIEVESPPGSGYVTLSPRQPVTPVPHARVAQQAVSMPWSGLTGQAEIISPGVSNGWQLLLSNSEIPGFRGGVRLADTGFLEITNAVSDATANFARLNSLGVWSAVSDARLKADVTPAEGNLAAALRLRPVNFRWKASGTEDFGLIAQEVRAVLPKLVTGDEAIDSLTLNYSQLSVVAIGAIQEQQRLISTLQRENADLRARLDRLERLSQPPAPKP